MPETMRALVWEGPGVLQLRLVPVPEVKNDEVLVKVSYSGICATDQEIFQGKFPYRPPYILGHELTGTVVKIGNAQAALREGERVVIDPAVPCEACLSCQSGKPEFCFNYRELGINMNGGWADYAVVPARCVHRIPDTMSDLAAAVFEPMTCPFGAVEAAGVKACDKVLVFGDGPAALYFTQIARMRGAAAVTVVYKLPERVEWLKKAGAATIIESVNMKAVEQTDDYIHTQGFDLVIDAVGLSETVQAAVRYAKIGGRIILYGFKDSETRAFPHREIILKNLTIYGRTNAPSVWPRAIEAVSRGYIEMESLVGQVLKPEQVKAFLEEGRSSCAIKTVIDWRS
ncbi:alcohol dehydrogenase catalytic domain-containing protein [Paenibacillus tyrfis]|uniref:alcohol dehydrogenase catalytic domain-containing protein n=1 Tax=Paenibacillus tyrfis TaxID=1501230 RepID=UPI0020A0CFF8|nr:alcohol dehydrogenase catalytic domain-containing protein [Paenibacillus tyrfis]MCP1306325.1 alcohol dehydrogenase catalytic domain-containing protein [Paenibacillus tyrfis]